MNLENMPTFKKLNDELNAVKDIIVNKETMLIERVVHYLNRNMTCSENFTFCAFENNTSKLVNCEREFFQIGIAINRIPYGVKKSSYKIENNTTVYYLDLGLDIPKKTFNLEHRLNNDIWHNFLEFNSEIFEFEKSIFKVNEMVYTNLVALKDIISEIFTDEYYEAKSQLSLKISKVKNFTDKLEIHMGENTFQCVENTIVSEMSDRATANNGILISDYYGYNRLRFKYSNNGIRNINRRNYQFSDARDVKHSIMYRNRNILKKKLK
jgi:hypothetical protein